MLKKLALAAVAVALLTGCSATDKADTAGTAGNRGDLSASRVKDYNSIAALQADSVAVVRVTVESSSIDQIKGLPFTVSQVRVHKTFWGQVPSATLAIRQVGEAGTPLHDTGAILAKDREYVLFVKPFHLDPGDSTGQYLITGDQGNFVKGVKGDQFEFAGAGEPMNLPKTFRTDEIESGAFLR